MKCSELRSTENLDFSRPRAYNGLKIVEVGLSVGDVLERRRLQMSEDKGIPF